jgi:DNA-binding CsgD family transcriptional regulator
MRVGLEALSEREKETLRLLLAGHDAKSIARDRGLSVHTVNERLRDARRKLDVTSSREAARRLGEAERGTPDNLGDKQSRVAVSSSSIKGELPGQPFGIGYPIAWLGGGMLIMSLIIAVAALLPLVRANGEPQSAPPTSSAQTVIQNEGGAAGAGMARAWVSLLDNRQWADTWRSAGSIFKAQMPEARWPSVIEPVRQPLGGVSSRSFLSATATTSLFRRADW